MRDTHGITVEFETYEAIREALFNAALSRSFDTRTYAEGNIRDGVVSISHGAMHRARRRVENTQFRPDRLRLYEHDLFPAVLESMLDRLIDDESVDIFPVGELISVVLAARRAGLDNDESSLDELRALVRIVDAFSQAAAILDAKDPEAVRALARAAHAEFERDFVRPAWRRRAQLIEMHRRGEIGDADLPHDILTVLLLYRDDSALELADDGRIVREVGTYLQGGTHTSAQTLANALDLLFEASEREPGIVDRVAADLLFAQRVVHETLRLRPTTPRMKRYAETETEIAGRHVPQGALVVLHAARANRDRSLFGEDADEFNPDRVVDPSVPRWGLSFGAGAHQCPGRSVAGGFPVPAVVAADGDHLHGLVASMLQAVAARGVHPDPARQPERDRRTERDTRWLHYPVRFERREVAGAVG